METIAPTIRNTVRAVIIRDDSILLQKKQKAEGQIYFTLPGGAQEPKEALLLALQRECIEEIGTEVIVEELIHLADYFKSKALPFPHLQHQLEILFRCQVPPQYQAINGCKPDKHQISVEWIQLNTLQEINLSPSFLTNNLDIFSYSSPPIYLGDYR